MGRQFERMKWARREFLVATLVVMATANAAPVPRDIELGDVRTRATPKGARTAATYLIIRNHSDRDDRLVEISSPLAESVRIEQPVWSGLEMHMEAVTDIAVPAGGYAILRAGGLQLTLINLTQQLRPGASVPLDFKFENAGRVAATSKVTNQLLAR